SAQLLWWGRESGWCARSCRRRSRWWRWWQRRGRGSERPGQAESCKHALCHCWWVAEVARIPGPKGQRRNQAVVDARLASLGAQFQVRVGLERGPLEAGGRELALRLCVPLEQDVAQDHVDELARVE